jgi:hypothetical protein
MDMLSVWLEIMGRSRHTNIPDKKKANVEQTNNKLCKIIRSKFANREPLRRTLQGYTAQDNRPSYGSPSSSIVPDVDVARPHQNDFALHSPNGQNSNST